MIHSLERFANQMLAQHALTALEPQCDRQLAEKLALLGFRRFCIQPPFGICDPSRRLGCFVIHGGDSVSVAIVVVKLIFHDIAVVITMRAMQI